MTTNDTNDAKLCPDNARSRGTTRAPSVDHTRRDALARSLGARFLRCNEDELRVIDVLLGRLEIGRDRYGHLDLAKQRDWKREKAEEYVDAAIYDACDLIARRDELIDRMRCEAADEISHRIEPGLVELRDASPVIPRVVAKDFERTEGVMREDGGSP